MGTHPFSCCLVGLLHLLHVGVRGQDKLITPLMGSHDNAGRAVLESLMVHAIISKPDITKSF